jgi:hypothetical protein
MNDAGLFAAGLFVSSLVLVSIAVSFYEVRRVHLPTAVKKVPLAK